jgi:hypothetical protein
MNYEQDIKIDETALDIEWLDQAALAIRYGRHWAECKKKANEAGEKIQIIRSELIALANSNPTKYCKKDKPNAADIEAFYRLHPRHIAAKEVWMDAQYELDMAEVAKNEMSFTRKAALENLVKLHGQQYFAGPKIPRNISEERSKNVHTKQINAGISAKFRRNK